MAEANIETTVQKRLKYTADKNHSDMQVLKATNKTLQEELQSINKRFLEQKKELKELENSHKNLQEEYSNLKNTIEGHMGDTKKIKKVNK